MTTIPLEDIEAAAERIKDRVRRTPFIRARYLLDPPREGEILLKLENLQVTGSFKARGANNAGIDFTVFADSMGLDVSGIQLVWIVGQFNEVHEGWRQFGGG